MFADVILPSNWLLLINIEAYRPSGGGDGEEEEGEGGGEISPMCESIGHRPLRGRCPKKERKKEKKKGRKKGRKKE